MSAKKIVLIVIGVVVLLWLLSLLALLATKGGEAEGATLVTTSAAALR